VLAGFAYYGTRRVTVNAYASQPLSLRSFVLVQTHFKVENGKTTITGHMVEAQRKDGTTVKTSPEIGIRRIDHPDGFTAMLVDKLKSKSTGQKPQEMVAGQKAHRQAAPLNCVFGSYEIVDGQDTILGQRAVRIIELPPTGLERTIYWRLPDFGCLNLQALIQTRPDLDAEWTTTNGFRPESFVEQEPDKRLFDVPTDYAELKPSEITHRVLQDAGISEKDCKNCLTQQNVEDNTYEKWGRPSYTP
jgi:hypothetical protein